MVVEVLAVVVHQAVGELFVMSNLGEFDVFD